MKKNSGNLIESILFVADKPVSIKELATSTGLMITEIQNCLNELVNDYKDRGIKLIRKGEYFSFVSDPVYADYVSKFLNEDLRHDLTKQGLETLAIVFYKQPVTRSEIEEVRGVNSDQLIRSLMVRGLICEVGRKETIGRPILYGTTMEFIQYFGLCSEEELPGLPDRSLFDKK